MIHLIWVAIVALFWFLIWYYDKPLRRWVKSHIGGHMDKAETEVKKFVDDAQRELVNRKTNDSQE